jgi:hypothetical protein
LNAPRKPIHWAVTVIRKDVTALAVVLVIIPLDCVAATPVTPEKNATSKRSCNKFDHLLHCHSTPQKNKKNKKKSRERKREKTIFSFFPDTLTV